MRTSLVVTGSLLVTVYLAARPQRADAFEHLMQVNEVMYNGPAGEQFVEFHDESPETLPNPPYRLEAFDAAGGLVGMIDLTGITGGAAVYYLAGNAAAVSTFSTANFRVQFTFTLPDEGQVCFSRPDGVKIHCIAWGCITNPVRNGQLASAPTPSGGSMSLQSATVLHVTGTPTPGAANGTGIALPACPGMIDAGAPDAPPGLDAATGPDAGPGGDDAGGCCRVSARTGAGHTALLALVVGLLVVRRRRR